MKKISTLLLAFGIALGVSAQQHGAMRFAGVANFSVAGASVDVNSDTIVYAGVSGTQADLTIPQMKYSMSGKEMVIPSFTIHNATFSMDMSTMTAVFGSQGYNETITVDDVEKAIEGTLVASYQHDAFNTFTLTTTFTYGSMPMPITYVIKAYYIKAFTNALDVSVGGAYNYNNESVTYNVRTYPEDEVTKLDVEVPSYTLTGTMMGNLTIGGYTVRGLVYDEAKGGYYRNYINDGLTMYFKAEQGGNVTMNDIYPLNAGTQEILLVYEGRQANISNSFKPGNMPFPITSSFPGTSAAGIQQLRNANNASAAVFNIAGQRVNNGAKGLLIKDGKKYFVK